VGEPKVPFLGKRKDRIMSLTDRVRNMTRLEDAHAIVTDYLYGTRTHLMTPIGITGGKAGRVFHVFHRDRPDQKLFVGWANGNVTLENDSPYRDDVLEDVAKLLDPVSVPQGALIEVAKLGNQTYRCVDGDASIAAMLEAAKNKTPMDKIHKHEYVNVGFNTLHYVCKHCDQERDAK